MKSRASYFGYIFFILIQVVLFIGTVAASEATTDDDWRHFYDISWSDKPSEDIRYAKQLGNDYIVVNPSLSGREYHKNPDCAGLKFYLADPYWYPQVLSGHSRYIDTTKPIPDAARDFYNQHMVWKGTDRFPNNLATGHHSGGVSSAYALVWDFQQQAVIDEVVERIIRTIKKYENRDLPFTFGGYILDEPKLSGEFFMVDEQGSNQSVPLSHWTGKDSGLTHDTITHEYLTYTEGRAAFYKQLFRRTRQEWPGMKVVMEQHDIYKDWIEEIKDRADSEELMADALFQKDAGTAFVDNEQSFDSGLITRDSVGITQQDEQGDYLNRLYAAKAAVNGAWYNWFYGTGGTSDFQGITKVPARQKLIRCLPNWDNLNNISLYDREWNGEVYQSTKSYASGDIIYSRHPKSGKVFAVFLTPSGVVKLNADETVTSVRCTNSFFVESGDGSDDATVVGDEIRLENKDRVGRGYIFTVSSDAVGNTLTTGTERGGTSGRETSDGMEDTTEVSATDYPGGEVMKIAYTGQTMKEKGVFARMPTDQQTGGTSVWQQVPLRTAAQKAAGLFGGEGMQNLYSISYSYTNPNIVYMCNDVAQILKSTDGGISWAFSHNGFLARAALSVAVSPLNENLVFAAGAIMSASLQTVSPADGIYRTVDGGKNWQQVLATGYYKRFNGGTHFAFTNSGVIYAATFDKGLVKSTDNGSTWATIWNPGDELVDIKIHPTNQNILFVVRPYGLWKVTDNSGSVTATRIGAGLPRNPASMVVDQQNPNNVYATVYQYGVYKSTDGGVNFSPINNGFNEAAGKETTSIAISPVDGNYLYVYFQNTTHLYYSNNGGSNWIRPSSMDERNAYGYVSGSQTDPNIPSQAGWATGPIAAHPKDKNIALAAGSFYHIKRTTDGGRNWKYSNSGYTGGALGTGGSGFSWDLKNPDRFAFFLMDYGGYLTEDNGSVFKSMRAISYKGLESTNAGAIDSSTGLIITAVGGWEEQILAKSTDNGVSWKHIPTDDAGNSTLSNYTFIGFHPQNPNIIYAQRFKGTRNPNTQAISWKMLSNPVKAVFKGNGDHVYSFYGKTIYKSTDAGITWTVHSTLPNPETSAAIYMIAIDPTNENRMYAAVLTNGIYVWNGTSWIKKGVSDGFTKDRFGKWNTLAVAVDPRSPNVVYAGNASPSLGQSNGIFRSTDYGATWQNISYNLGSEFNAFGIGVNPHNGYVYLGSYHGTWKLPPPYGTNSVDTISPTITITGPTSGATYATTNNTLNLNGSASDDSGISTITWSNNKGGGGAASGTNNWSVSGITLVSGDNLITVTARDAAGNTGTDTITVTYTPGKAPQVATGAFYTFDEGKGTIAADTSGNGNDGIINGAVWTTGKNGSGLRFNGIDNYVSIPSMNFNEISISAWFYKNANDTVNADAIFGGWKQNANAQNEEGLELRFYNGRPDTLQFGVITQNSSGVRREGFAIYNLGNSVGKWHHVTGTYNKATGEQKLYVNGQLVNTQNHPAGNTVVPLTYYSDMRIGHSRADNGYFNGVIDDVRIYNRALSNQEVINIYNSVPGDTPQVTTGSATNITTNAATLNGTVNANGLSTTVWFQYGATSGSYGSTTSIQTVGGTSSTPVSASINGLSAGVKYYYRIVAQNSVGTSYGTEQSLTTAASTSGGTTTGATGAFYTFDEGKGTIAADTSGNGNDGTINGAVWMAGKNGSGLRFNGIDNYVSIPPMNFNEISISAWFYKNANDTVNADAIFGGWKQNANAQNEEGLELRFYNGRPDTLQFGVITQNSSGVRREGFAIYNLGNSVGKWYHVTGTYTKTTGEQKLYVNGQLVNTQNHPAGNTVVPLTYYSDMRIGHSRTDNGYFNGVIDDVRIYNRALSNQEVINIYNSVPGDTPQVTTGSATNITTNAATLNGTVNANGLSTTVWFQYGATSGSYGSTTSIQTVGGTSSTPVSASINGLSAGVKYYYRIVAQNSVGTSYGTEQSLTTAASTNGGTTTGTTGAFYTFDEGKGTIAADTSGNGNDGTINGAVWTTGKNGSGLRFNGIDNYVSIPPMNFNEISISAWFYKNANDTVNADAIFGGWKQNANAQNEEGLELRFYNGRPDTLQFGVITQNSSGVRREGFAIYNLGNSVGKWYHVTGTYTKTTGEQKLYVNGQLVNTQNHPAGNTVVPLTYYSDMRIGHSRTDNGYFNGVIDDVRIYNRALSSQDVSTIYSGNI